MHCTPIHISCEKGNFAIAISITWYNSLIINKIKEKFDLTPNGIIKYLDLQKPIFAKTTNYGHLGKDYLPWEKIIKM